MRSRILLVSTLLAASCARHRTASTAESDYAPSESCRVCHAAVADRYRGVAMARSLYRPNPSNVIEDYRRNNLFYHAVFARRFHPIGNVMFATRIVEILRDVFETAVPGSLMAPPRNPGEIKMPKSTVRHFSLEWGQRYTELERNREELGY